jgi:hypothetical protein
MAITFEGRPIGAGEVGRTIDFTDLGLEWEGEGFEIYLRIWNDADDPTAYNDYEMTALDDPESARLTTTAVMFPGPYAQTYPCAVVVKLPQGGGLPSIDQMQSQTFNQTVKGNQQTPGGSLGPGGGLYF